MGAPCAGIEHEHQRRRAQRQDASFPAGAEARDRLPLAVAGAASKRPVTAIVVVTMQDSPAYARAAIDAGAVGYVLKEYAAHDLAVAVRCAARGEEYVSARVGARLGALQASVDGDGLRPREVEVLRLIALGFTSAEISEKLDL